MLIFALPVHAISYFPADPDAFEKQWYLSKIEAYEAWSKTRGSSEVVVAVIDTGVDIDHPELKDNIWTNPLDKSDGLDNDGNIYIDDIHGWDFVDGDNDPSPNLNERAVNLAAVNHGTMISGIIAGISDNGIGISGIASRVRILPLRALDSTGRGNVATVMEAVRYAMRNGASIINLSFVGNGFDTDLFLLLREATKRGILTVAAVGNEETVGIDLDAKALYPVCYTGEPGEDVVLGVAALGKDDTKPRFSNYGENCVDVTAPGVDIYSTALYRPSRGFSGLFGMGSGSSLAAPQVAGVAALIKSLNPAYQAADIRQIILASADPVSERDPALRGKLGKGRLNARRALELAASGGFIAAASDVPYILTAPFSRAAAEIQIVRSTGSTARRFSPFESTWRGGIRLASGALQSGGTSLIVAARGPGGEPQVRVFNPDGVQRHSWLAYAKGFRGGVSVGVGDVDGDHLAEVVTGAGKGGGPHVRIFQGDGRVKGGFFAYGSAFRGGVQVVVTDIDGDGRAEIITAPGPGRGSGNEVRIFERTGRLKKSFVAFPSSFFGGINLAAGDLDGDGTAEIIVSPQGTVAPEVRVYSGGGSWQRAFLVYTDAFLGGVNLAIGDLDRDGKGEIMVAPGPGGGPHLKILDGFGQLKSQFFPYEASFRGGVSVGIIKL